MTARKWGKYHDDFLIKHYSTHGRLVTSRHGSARIRDTMKDHQKINIAEEIEAFSDSKLLADQLVRIADEIGDAQTSYWLKESAAHINGMWRVMNTIKSGNIAK